MFRKILVQIDPARPVHQAPRFARELAEQTKAELVALYVVDEKLSSMMGSDLVRTMDQALAAVGEEALAAYQKRVGKGVRFTKAVGYGDTAAVIAKYVQRHAVDLVVTGGFHASVYQRIPFGSVVNEILRRTPASLFLYRDSHPDPRRPGPVVYAHDGSLPARRGLHVASEMARELQQSVDVVHVHGAKRLRAQQVIGEVEEAKGRLPVDVATHLLRRKGLRRKASMVLDHAKEVEAPYIALPRSGEKPSLTGLDPVVERLVVHTDRPLLVIQA